MSTRSQIQVFSEGLPWDDDKITLYRHSDGYPTGALPTIKEAYAMAVAPTVYGEGENAWTANDAWKAGRVGKAASFLCAAYPGGIEPEAGHDLHGDIEYLYRIYVINHKGGTIDETPTWEVEIYIPGRGFDGEFESMVLAYPRTRLDKMDPDKVEKKVSELYEEMWK